MKTEQEINIILELLLDIGEKFLENGAETYRAEQAVTYMFNSIGEGKINAFALTTMLSVDLVINEKHYCGVRRISGRTINLDKIEKLNKISRDVQAKKITINDAVEVLNKMNEETYGSFPLSVFAYGVAASIFALFLGGGPLESLGAGASCMLVQLILVFVKNVASFGFFSSLIGGFIPALAGALLSLIIPCDIQNIAIAGMLPHFPGVSMVTAIRDTINGDILSGVARGAEAALSAIGLAMGAMLVLYIRLYLI